MKKLLCSFLVCCSLNAKVINIMPIGDSITWGAVGPNLPPALGGYRSPLYEAIKACGQQVMFLGADNGNPSPLLTLNKEDYHCGYRGFRIDELSQCLDGPNPYPGNIGYWFTILNMQPDIILLMAGTNDILQGKGVMVATNNMDAMIAKIHRMRPHTTIILSQIPPIFGSVAQQAEQFNTNLIGLVDKYKKLGVDITLVYMYVSLLPFGKQFSDAVHPDAVTYRAMVLTWLPSVLVAIWQRNTA